MEATVKAFGKILIFGAYSILEEGNIGLVVNIDKGTTTTAQETQQGRMVIDLSSFKVSIYGRVEGGKVKKLDAEALKFIKNAVDYAFKYLQEKNVKISDIRLITYNDAELYVKKKLKSGFGSSATSTVSTVAAILTLHNIENRNLIHKISKYSHYKTQGDIGSGFDISATCLGSHYFVAKPKMEQDFLRYLNTKTKTFRETFNWPFQLLPVIIHTGKSASTPELVSKVMAYKKDNPSEYSKFMHSYNQVNLEVKKAFDELDFNQIKFKLERSWSMRKHLGKLADANIEDDSFTRLVSEMKDNGAFTAGLIGAGGGDSILAICLNKEDKERLLKFLKKKRLMVFADINIVTQGYKVIGHKI